MTEKYIIENAQQLLGILYDLETPSALDILQAYKDLEGTLEVGEVAELHRLEENGFVLAVGDEIIFSNTELEIKSEEESEESRESRLDNLEDKMDKLFSIISELSETIDDIVSPKQDPIVDNGSELKNALDNVEMVFNESFKNKEDILEKLYNLAYEVNEDKDIPFVLLELENAEMDGIDKDRLADAIKLLTEDLPQMVKYDEMVLAQIESELDNLPMIPEVCLVTIEIEDAGFFVKMEGNVLYFEEDLLQLVNDLRKFV